MISSMVDDELKQLLAEHHAEIRRHFDAAIDEIDRSNKILAERLGCLKVKIDRIDTPVDLTSPLQAGSATGAR